MATGTWKVDMVLLWTNPNPSADFAAGTVNVDLSGFKKIGIVFSQVGLVIFEPDLAPIYPSWLNSWAEPGNVGFQIGRRLVTVTATGVTFGDVVYVSNSLSSGLHNNWMKPVRIYGINM